MTQSVKFWSRLFRYRDQGPEQAEPFELLPAKELRDLVLETADQILSPAGWQHVSGLCWRLPLPADWLFAQLEFQKMRGGLSARWGLHIPGMPRIRRSVTLDLSFDPLDYDEPGSDWQVGVLATRDEVKSDCAEIVGKALERVSGFVPSGTDMSAVLRCFEKKEARQYVRFGLESYPQEALAYSVLLGLTGQKQKAEDWLDKAMARSELSDKRQDQLREEVQKMWSKGIESLYQHDSCQ